MLAEVDNFVPKYAGEDLRETVVAEIKRRFNAKVKENERRCQRV